MEWDGMGWIMRMERGKGKREEGCGLQEIVDGIVDVVVHVVVGPAGPIVELVGVVGSTTRFEVVVGHGHGWRMSYVSYRFTLQRRFCQGLT